MVDLIFPASKSRAQIEVFVKGGEAHLTTTEVSRVILRKTKTKTKTKTVGDDFEEE